MCQKAKLPRRVVAEERGMADVLPDGGQRSVPGLLHDGKLGRAVEIRLRWPGRRVGCGRRRRQGRGRSRRGGPLDDRADGIFVQRLAGDASVPVDFAEDGTFTQSRSFHPGLVRANRARVRVRAEGDGDFPALPLLIGLRTREADDQTVGACERRPPSSPQPAPSGETHRHSPPAAAPGRGHPGGARERLHHGTAALPCTTDACRFGPCRSVRRMPLRVSPTSGCCMPAGDG